jgi:hypothetical protein
MTEGSEQKAGRTDLDCIRGLRRRTSATVAAAAAAAAPIAPIAPIVATVGVASQGGNEPGHNGDDGDDGNSDADEVDGSAADEVEHGGAEHQDSPGQGDGRERGGCSCGQGADEQATYQQQPTSTWQKRTWQHQMPAQIDSPNSPRVREALATRRPEDERRRTEPAFVSGQGARVLLAVTPLLGLPAAGRPMMQGDAEHLWAKLLPVVARMDEVLVPDFVDLLARRQGAGGESGRYRLPGFRGNGRTAAAKGLSPPRTSQ